MDEVNNGKIMCALAMITNENDESFSVEKLVEYYSGHSELDKAYKWGMRWKPGRK